MTVNIEKRTRASKLVLQREKASSQTCDRNPGCGATKAAQIQSICLHVFFSGYPIPPYLATESEFVGRGGAHSQHVPHGSCHVDLLVLGVD